MKYRSRSIESSSRELCDGDQCCSSRAAVYALLSMVAAQAGATVSAHELANTIGVSLTAVKNYFHVLQKANIIGERRPFSRNVRKELTKKPKIYFRDSGYRNAVLDCFRPISNRIDAGETLENVFYGECVKAGLARIQFWRTQGGNEIDFVLNEHSAFELKMNPAKFSRKKVRSFLEAYPEIPLSVVTARSDKELALLLEIEDGFYAMKGQQGRSVHSSDARHLNGLSGLLDKPLIHSFLVSHDPTVKQFRTRMTAIPAAALLS